MRMRTWMMLHPEGPVRMTLQTMFSSGSEGTHQQQLVTQSLIVRRCPGPWPYSVAL